MDWVGQPVSLYNIVVVPGVKHAERMERIVPWKEKTFSGLFLCNGVIAMEV